MIAGGSILVVGILCVIFLERFVHRVSPRNLQRRAFAGESMREIRGDTAMRGKRAGAPRRVCLPERVPGVGRVGGARPIETGREECGREWCLLAKCSKPFENADPFFLRSFREPRRTALPFKPRSGTRPPSGYAGGGPRAPWVNFDYITAGVWCYLIGARG